MNKPTNTRKKQAPNRSDDGPRAVQKTDGVLPQWQPHLDCYKEKRVLTFPSRKHLKAAIQLLWTEALRALPHDTADGETLIVPAAAVPFFSQAGLPFTERRLRSLSELPPEKVDQLRREQGPY